MSFISLRFPKRRKISAHEFERGGLLKPIVNTIDGTPTFLSSDSSLLGTVQNQNGTTHSIISRSQRLSRNELKQLDEKELIFELVSFHKSFNLPYLILMTLVMQVKDICNELDVRSLGHKILQNVSTLLNADRGSLFLVQRKTTTNGTDGPKK